MRTGDVVKHVRCVDAAFLVKKVQYRGPNYHKVRGYWVNVGYPGRAHMITYQPETIKIFREQLLNWKVVEVPELLPRG